MAADTPVHIDISDESTTATRDKEMKPASPSVPKLELKGTLDDNRPVVSSLKGKLEGLSSRVLGALTPRSSSRWGTPRTPREPEEKIIQACLVLEKTFAHDKAQMHTVPEYHRKAKDPSGIRLDGATVTDLSGLLVHNFGAHHDWAVQRGDVVLKVDGERFESSRPLCTYLPDEPHKRCFTIEVRRLVYPPSWPLTARLSKAVLEVPYPENEE